MLFLSPDYCLHFCVTNFPSFILKLRECWLRYYQTQIKKVMAMISQLMKVGKEDPRRVVHSLKVALAITVVSLFYYVKPLYNGFGSSAMWAVFTVIVVFEFYVGKFFRKCFNSCFATFLAGAMGSMSMGHIEEPILLGALIFLITAGVTYFRFLPQMKARYDYGLLVFILTFCMTLIEIRSKIQEPCMKMSTETGKALKKLAVAIHKMIPPSSADTHIANSKVATTSLRSIIKTGFWEETNLFDVFPVLTVASLLVDVVSCTERLAESIQELATLAKFENNILP
uniref:Aluminum-activated malate transporter 8 n=1 Tax=Cajanus cajan TaxID=3821 RepID=A0A151QTW9_CAJCA|nr:hypothetical protein KK1_045350 [Cajanus cajan]